MADISKITLPSGVTYNIKDAVAREALASGVIFLGITTTELTDGASTSSIIINGKTINAVNGGIAVYGNKEFIYSSADSSWHEIGDTTNLGDLALKDNASGAYTPAGTITPAVITVTPNTTMKYVASSETGGGIVTNGTAAACTLPVLTMSVVNGELSVNWTSGSFTPNTPTDVTLPTFASQTIATGISSVESSQQTFNGTPATITVS